MAGIAVASVVGLAVPAYAHHTSVRGSVECSNGDHLVHWDIQNDESDQPMTIVSATASVNGQSYPVVGYTSPVAVLDYTSATTTVPNGVGGIITLTVNATWPDEYSVTNTASVQLQENCCTTTTTAATTTTLPDTTTTAATTTTAPEVTTTTAAPTTTTTMQELGSTTIVTTTTQAPTTTKPVVDQGSTVPTTSKPAIVTPQLPRTGSGTLFPIIFGLSSIAAGVLLLKTRNRSAWSR